MNRLALVASMSLLAACSSGPESGAAGPTTPAPVAPETPPPSAPSAPSAEGPGAPEPSAPAPSAPAEAPAPGSPAPRDAREAFAAASNALAFDLYARAKATPGNLAFSPASIELALGMTWAGARGATADEMARVLRIGASPEAHHAAAGRILASWNDPARRSSTLRVVNRLFGERSFAFERAFLELTRTRYGAALEPVDFRGAPEPERRRINAWVLEQTNERIDDLLPAGSIDALTRLVLVNAVYFLGRWAEAFDESATRDEPFHAPAGAVTAPTMSRTATFRYAELDDAQVLELPYRGGELAMTVVLPRTRDGLPAVESALDAADLARWLDALEERRVEVHLPRFEIRDARLPLTEILPAMGMRLAFDAGRADFGAMARSSGPGGGLFLSDVFHECFVKVDEQGTEAAAPTGAVMRLRGMARPEPPVPVFRADHPFLFFVRELGTGTVLFVGRVERP